CDALVRECNDPWVGDEQALVQRALAAFRAGHHEAAMALAVSIGEPLANWASTPRVRGFLSEADRDTWEKKRHKTSNTSGWHRRSITRRRRCTTMMCSAMRSSRRSSASSGPFELNVATLFLLVCRVTSSLIGLRSRTSLWRIRYSPSCS